MDTECDNRTVLDLSKQSLKKLPKQDDAQSVRVLILDENEFQKIDNIDSYLRIEKLSLCKNQLLRMYGVCRLHHLQELQLAYNGILTIEGLKELSQLTHLNLEGNNIKAIEHLNTNIKLEYLNLSENSIGNISDISYLKCLKELNLHGNRITHLRQCEKYLPNSLETLSLAKNNLTDLNEIGTLSHLCNLYSFSIVDNPCVQMTGNVVGFDYRPFVLNWCMSVKVIDGFIVNAIESLKAEWLYSQGRGRQFRIGEQVALARYLSSVCPLSGEVLENENERKLRLILSKAQQHQRQLQEEISENANTSGSNSPSSSRRKGQSSRIQSPRFSRLGAHRQGSPDSMSSSYHGNTSNCSLMSSSQNETVSGGVGCSGGASNNMNSVIQMSTSLISNIKNDTNLMVQSLDPTILANNTTSPISTPNKTSQQLNNSNSQLNCIDQTSQNRQSSPLVAASKMVPVPETLMSPDCPPNSVIHRNSATVSHLTAAVSAATNAYSPKTGKLKSSNIGGGGGGGGGGSPKSNRHSVTNSNSKTSNNKFQSDKSPNLNHTRKNNQNIALATTQKLNNENQQRIHQNNHLQHPQQQNLSNMNRQHQKPLPSNVVHISQPENNSCNVSSEDDIDGDDGDFDDDDDDDDSDRINVDKLKTIRNKAAQKSQQKDSNQEVTNMSFVINKHTEQSAVLIQKLWRGHQARLKFKSAAKVLQKKRTQEYIEKLTVDIESTKLALENERKIQQLQMQAINALWKKVSTMQQPTNSQTTATQNDGSTNKQVSVSNAPIIDDNQQQAIVQDLAKTCSLLTNQVQQLQGSMQDILQCITVFCNLPQNSTTNSSDTTQKHPTTTKLMSIDEDNTTTQTKTTITQNNQHHFADNCGTQTEIIAVHTPQVDNPPFPFNNKLQRPSTLPLDSSNETSPLPPHDFSSSAATTTTITSDEKESSGGIVGGGGGSYNTETTISTIADLAKLEINIDTTQNNDENNKDLAKEK